MSTSDTATKIDPETGVEVNLVTYLTYGDDKPYKIVQSEDSNYCYFSHPKFGHLGGALSFGAAATKTQKHAEQRMRWAKIEVGQIVTDIDILADMPVGTMLVDREDGAFYRIAYRPDDEDLRGNPIKPSDDIVGSIRTSAAGRNSWGASGTIDRETLDTALERGLEVVWVGPGR